MWSCIYAAMYVPTYAAMYTDTYAPTHVVMYRLKYISACVGVTVRPQR